MPKLLIFLIVLLGCAPATAPPTADPAPHDAPISTHAPGDTLVVPVPGADIRLVLAWVPGPEPVWMVVHEVTHDQYARFRHRRLDDDVVVGDAGAGDPPAADPAERADADPALVFDADAVARPSPPYEDPVHGMGKGDHPAGGMTRLAALRYARWLSEKTGRLFRLASEAEWERACLAGAPGPYGFAGDLGPGDSADRLAAHAWYEANSAGAFHSVGGKAPNAWGLRDMHGNVAEWVMEGPPESWTTEQARGRGVVRGGAFDDPAGAVGCDARFEETAAWKRRDPQIPKSRWWNTDSPHVGFRVVMEPTWTRAEITAFWARLLDG